MTYYSDDQVTLYHGDALAVARTLGAGAADCIVTSPPYFGLRDYGIAGQCVRIPRYISDYVNNLSERDVRHQYAQLLAKRHAEQRKSTITRWTGAGA